MSPVAFSVIGALQGPASDLLAAAGPPQPSVISQYGPLIASLVALSGAMITLFVTLVVSGRREEVRRRDQAREDYNREQRVAVAAVAVAAHDFRRTVLGFYDADRLSRQGHESVRRHREAAEDASAALLNALTVARLLIHERSLQEPLDRMYAAFAPIRGAMTPVLEAYTARQYEVVRTAASGLDGAWEGFLAAAGDLQDAALEWLAPWVLGRRRL